MTDLEHRGWQAGMPAPPTEPCADWLERLSDHLDGRFPAVSAAAAEVERHLAGCAGCRAARADFAALGAAWRETEVPELSAAEARALARLAARAARSEATLGRFRRRWLVPFAAAASAAATLLALQLGSLLRGPPPGPAATGAPTPELVVHQPAEIQPLPAGIMLAAEDPSGRALLGVEPGAPVGIRVAGVAPGSPAWRMGLKAGDVIFSFDGQEFLGSGLEEQLRFLRAIQAAGKGTEVSLLFSRSGRVHRVSGVLGEYDFTAAERHPDAPPEPAGPGYDLR